MASPTFQTLLYDVDQGVATITLNRPDKLNAFTGQMMLDLIAAFDATDASPPAPRPSVPPTGRWNEARWAGSSAMAAVASPCASSTASSR